MRLSKALWIPFLTAIIIISLTIPLSQACSDDWIDEWCDDDWFEDYSFEDDLPGDVNGDGKVDLTDLSEAILAWGSNSSHPRWNPKADVVEDGEIDILDILRIIILFGNRANAWDLVFEDVCGRGTILKINLAKKCFQFITPDKDYGVRNATCMRLAKFRSCRCMREESEEGRGRLIIIKHLDDELRLLAVAHDSQKDLCITIAWDRQTQTRYFLIDKVGIED
ncbi:MAG: hypothetical protein JSV51_06145 [Candidatus Bathyarchaeota archaeon]|nr:MAG: hypothetical protein JSV51_06145 [Candidatus Bathyarchaeota archaeon]